ncbi:MAG: acetyltransferase-like isoleucine patch superfamily enzyme [Rhodothermales bacterium]|jgi:acetyltransferase-like isoleucine patch superfamily enzyme
MTSQPNLPRILQVGVRDVTFGKRVTIVEPSNLYECELGDDAFVGPFVEIQKGVIIGRGCRIQSHSFICELVEIGDDCFISHGVRFVNDLFRRGGPAMGDTSLWLRTKVGDRVSIGTGAVVLPVEIASDTVIGAGAVVTKDIKKGGVYAGNPARFIRDL